MNPNEVNIPAQSLETWQSCDVAIEMLKDMKRGLGDALISCGVDLYLEYACIGIDDLISEVQDIRDRRWEESPEGIAEAKEEADAERDLREECRRMVA